MHGFARFKKGINMNDLEKQERKIAHDICLDYSGCPNEIYDIMFDAVSKGVLTFEKLASVIRKVHFCGMTKDEMKDACEICRKLSLTGIDIMGMKTIIDIRKMLFEKYKIKEV